MYTRPRLLGAGIVVAALCVLAAWPSYAAASHVSCGDTITQDTTLDSDLVNCQGDGIVIGADNITLDLNGHTIDGDLTRFLCCWSGVTSTGFAGVEIENGTIQEFENAVLIRSSNNVSIHDLVMHDFSEGIPSGDSDNGVIRDNVIKAPGGRGISIGGTFSNLPAGNLIEDNVVSGMGGVGIDVARSAGNSVRDNSLIRNGTGVELFTPGNTRVEENRFIDNGAGMDLNGATSNLIERNVFTRGFVGLFLEQGSRDNTIAHNALRRQVTTGIDLDFSDSNLVQGNVLSKIGSPRPGFELQTGILIYRGVGNRILDNSVTMRGVFGAYLIRAEQNRLEGNRVRGASDDGINIDSGSNVVTSNRANHNGDYGIAANPSVIDGGGNRAKHNGNPSQCLNVACK
jgi:parallel beta-helix repeat protein